MAKYDYVCIFPGYVYYVATTLQTLILIPLYICPHLVSKIFYDVNAAAFGAKHTTIATKNSVATL